MQQPLHTRVAPRDVAQCGELRTQKIRHRSFLKLYHRLAGSDRQPAVPGAMEQVLGMFSHLTSRHQQLARAHSSSVARCQEQQQSQSSSWMVLPAVAMHQMCMSLQMPAHATENISPAAIDLFREFLDQIHALGPWGGALFILTVMLAEMVPLFPTQPLTLASGLLFGPIKGAVFVVVGVTLAAANAFTISRGIGRKVAEKVVAHEMGDGAATGPVARQLAAVNKAIESGGFMQQVTAITLLRLTPVVPFSASNYLLGMTPVQLPPMLLGTVAGMSIWSLLYASLGGASRQLLESGAELDVLLEDLGEKAGQYSTDVAVCGLVLGAAAGAYYLLTHRHSVQEQDGSSHQTPAPLDSTRTPEEVLQQK